MNHKQNLEFIKSLTFFIDISICCKIVKDLVESLGSSYSKIIMSVLFVAV